jgi:hypothetical protein
MKFILNLATLVCTVVTFESSAAPSRIKNHLTKLDAVRACYSVEPIDGTRATVKVFGTYLFANPDCIPKDENLQTVLDWKIRTFQLTRMPMNCPDISFKEQELTYELWQSSMFGIEEAKDLSKKPLFVAGIKDALQKCGQ